MKNATQQVAGWPTRKAAVGTMIAGALGQLWANTADEFFPFLGGEEVSTAVGWVASCLIGYLIFYFVKDRPNVPE